MYSFYPDAVDVLTPNIRVPVVFVDCRVCPSGKSPRTSIDFYKTETTAFCVQSEMRIRNNSKIQIYPKQPVLETLMYIVTQSIQPDWRDARVI